MAGNTSNTNFTYTHYIYAYMCETTDDIHTLARRIKKLVFLCFCVTRAKKPHGKAICCVTQIFFVVLPVLPSKEDLGEKSVV